MADYSSFQAMIDAGTTNMTAQRNNVKQDDGTDTVSAGTTWFHYNGAAVSNLYASGNSWIGIGSSSEHLKINRRDCAMYYLYKESGTVNGHQFYKLRWRGYSYYNQTSDAYLQQYDVFLFDTGQIYLRFFDVPTTTGSGTNSLVCGSQTVTYAVTAGVACEYTFTPSDATAGTGWSVAAGVPDWAYNYAPSGTAVFSIPLTRIGSYLSSEISWTAETPADTAVTVDAATGTTSPTTWQTCTSGEEIPGLTPGGDYSTKNLYIRATLATEDIHATPELTGITVQLRDDADANRIVLVLGAGNRTNLQKAANGEVYIRYANGDLSGEDMPVENFLESFTPEDVAYKGNQNPHEHLEITGASYTGTLRKIEYASAQDDRNSHLAITGASYTGVLTYIEPI